MDEAWPTALLELRPPYVWLKEEGGGGAMQGRAGQGWASTEIENGIGFALVAWHDTTKRIESMNGV